MKKLAVILTVSLTLLGLSCSSNQPPSTSESPAPVTTTSTTSSTFMGEIMDSPCAMMGSHTQMMKKEKAKDARECTLDCVRDGAKFVLYNAPDKTTYQLDDQVKPKDFAGQQVKVTGTLDTATNTVHVEKIEAA